MMKTQTLRTGLSAAYWCDPSKGYTFEPAYLPAMTRSNSEHTAWFDELFEEGLRIPEKGSGTAMTLLVTGSPGTGKTTLSLEFCYRLGLSRPDSVSLRSLYLTTEGHAPWLIAHAREFGWDLGETVLGTSPNAPVCVKALKTREDFEAFKLELRADQAGASTRRSFSEVIERLHSGIFGPHESEDAGAHDPGDESTPSTRAARQPNLALRLSDYDILVFDNLNTMQVDKGLWFQMLADLGKSGPRLVIVVLDSGDIDGTPHSWDFLADVVIRMSRENRETGGYLIRTIEILKSRYQLSALGRHQVKINKAFPLKDDTKDPALRMRHHPFREEGGIFIYPSMHFVLSRHKYLDPEPAVERIAPNFDGFRDLLSGGFHAGRCVAFTGERGTHKSRLAYVQLLWTLRNNTSARGIVISLGDDEKATAKNLAEIVKDQSLQTSPSISVDELIHSGRLEIAYYPPGFITPEEFFHRLQLSIARHRRDEQFATVMVVFDSLNLLHSHFPLCAEHKVFIPAVVELLGHEGVTSFFVSGVNQADDQYGLLSLADPILQFRREPQPKSVVLGTIIPRDIDGAGLSAWPDEVALVRMEVARFAGGTSAGEHAYLYLSATSDPLSKVAGGGEGLHFWLPHSHRGPASS